MQSAGTAAAQASPRGGRFDTNSSAKSWVLLSPEGDRYEITNLKLWARGHTELFGFENTEANAAKIARGFVTIAGNIRHDRRGQTYKGWTVVEHDMRKNCEK